MGAQQVVDLSRETLWVAILVGAPGLLAALAVGLVVSLLQAMTQLQEATLAFVPKILVVGGVLLLTMPFALQSLSSFTERLFQAIGSGG